MQIMVIRRKDMFEAFYARNSKIFKSRTDAKAAFDDMFKLIEESLVAGNDLVITGFGKFWVSHLKPRPVRNPREQTTTMGVAKDAARFTPSQALQLRMNHK